MNATAIGKRIKSVQVVRVADRDPDLSHLGEYSSRPGADDVTIDREERGDMGRGEYRYFIAAMSGEDTGNPESVEQDYARCEAYNRGEWEMVGVYAVAEVVVNGTTQAVRSAGLWGVESDSGDAYFAEVGGEELAELSGILAELGFTPEQIAEAFAEVEPAGEYK